MYHPLIRPRCGIRPAMLVLGLLLGLSTLLPGCTQTKSSIVPPPRGELGVRPISETSTRAFPILSVHMLSEGNESPTAVAVTLPGQTPDQTILQDAESWDVRRDSPVEITFLLINDRTLVRAGMRRIGNVMDTLHQGLAHRANTSVSVVAVTRPYNTLTPQVVVPWRASGPGVLGDLRLEPLGNPGLLQATSFALDHAYHTDPRDVGPARALVVIAGDDLREESRRMTELVSLARERAITIYGIIVSPDGSSSATGPTHTLHALADGTGGRLFRINSRRQSDLEEAAGNLAEMIAKRELGRRYRVTWRDDRVGSLALLNREYDVWARVETGWRRGRFSADILEEHAITFERTRMEGMLQRDAGEARRQIETFHDWPNVELYRDLWIEAAGREVERYLAANELAKADPIMQRLSDLTRDRRGLVDLWRRQGDAELAAGRLTQAETYFRRILDEPGVGDQDRRRLARVLTERAMADPHDSVEACGRALTLLTEARNMDQTYPAAEAAVSLIQLRMAALQLDRGDVDGAVRTLQGRRDGEAVRLMVTARINQAEQQIRSAVPTDPGFAARMADAERRIREARDLAALSEDRDTLLEEITRTTHSLMARQIDFRLGDMQRVIQDPNRRADASRARALAEISRQIREEVAPFIERQQLKAHRQQLDALTGTMQREIFQWLPNAAADVRPILLPLIEQMEDAQALWLRAGEAARDGRWQEASSLFAASAAIRPDERWGYHRQWAESAAMAGDFATAFGLLAGKIEQEPSSLNRDRASELIVMLNAAMLQLSLGSMHPELMSDPALAGRALNRFVAPRDDVLAGIQIGEDRSEWIGNHNLLTIPQTHRLQTLSRDLESRVSILRMAEDGPASIAIAAPVGESSLLLLPAGRFTAQEQTTVIGRLRDGERSQIERRQDWRLMIEPVIRPGVLETADLLGWLWRSIPESGRDLLEQRWKAAAGTVPQLAWFSLEFHRPQGVEVKAFGPAAAEGDRDFLQNVAAASRVVLIADGIEVLERIVPLQPHSDEPAFLRIGMVINSVPSSNP